MPLNREPIPALTFAAALAASFLFPVLPSMGNAMDNDRYFRALIRARDAINTMTGIKEQSIEDRRKDGKKKSRQVTELIVFDRSSGKVRHKLVSIRPEPRFPKYGDVQVSRGNNGDLKKVRLMSADYPEPTIIYDLPHRLHTAIIRSVPVSGGNLLEIRWPRQVRQGVSEDLLMNKDGLPVRIRTYGSRGQVLDEAEVEWQTVGGISYPTKLTIIRLGRLNDLIATTRYSGITINGPVSGTLFTQP